VFTGIVEELGTVKHVQRQGDLQTCEISAEVILTDLKEGDSINVDGACQTVTGFNSNSFTIVSVEETLRLTTLGSLQAGALVNLERSLRPQDRMGGHIVLGHVDGVGTILHLEAHEHDSTLLRVSLPAAAQRFVALKGSVTVQGISLTVAAVDADSFAVAIIPYTLQHTSLRTATCGDQVNLEVDLIARYVERLLSPDTAIPNAAEITPERLDEMGY
jgi:riboflavin synthase